MRFKCGCLMKKVLGLRLAVCRETEREIIACQVWKSSFTSCKSSIGGHRDETCYMSLFTTSENNQGTESKPWTWTLSSTEA